MKPLVVAGLVLMVPAAGHAQRLTVMTGVAPLQRHVRYQGAPYRQTGTFIGASGALALGPLLLRLDGLKGTLDDTATVATKTDLRTTALGVLVQPIPWIALGARVDARHFESPVGVVNWKLAGGNVVLTPPLGGSGLVGLLDVAYFPFRSDSNMSLAYQATVGISLVTRGLFTARVAYRFERYDFTATGTQPARLEQFRGAVAGVGVRLGRR